MDSAARPPDAKQPADNFQVYLYFGALTLFIYLATPTGALVDIATSFMLKNQLHASPEAVARFRFITAIPVFVAFIFGFIRDTWNPLGLRDRGYFLIFSPLTAAMFVWLAFSKLTLTGLYIGILSAILAFRLVMSAYQGLISLVGQEKLMSGRLSTVWNVVLALPTVAAAWASGYVTEHLTAQQIFILLAALCFALGLFGLWKSKTVFEGAYEDPHARGASLRGDMVRLFKHKAIYPAVAICFLWNFSPGSATPLQFYLTNELHASDAVYSNYNAIFALFFIPTFLLYGFLCKRHSLRKLLWWGTIIGVPQMIPLAFIHSGTAAEILAAPIGLMGGIATAAYFDLAMRSCPPGLQGTLMMMVDGVFALSSRGGDMLGTWIYSAGKPHGFLYCVIATTLVYAAILPLILLIPKHIIATADGEENPEAIKEVLAEIAEAS